MGPDGSEEKAGGMTRPVEDQPVKACPQCGAAYGPEVNFCPEDGTALVVQPLRKTCPQCGRDYPLDVRFCAADGTELLSVMPVGEGFDKTITLGGEEYGVRKLDEPERDHIRRSLCPDCGAWKNWAGEGREYICRSCGSHFLYEGEDAFKVLGKMDEQGKLVADTGGGTATKGQRELEASPFYKLLTEIDLSNRDHWIRKFKGFEEGKFNRSWNWPSFFFGSLRYFLKGMSARGVLYLFGAVVLSLGASALLGSQTVPGNPFNYVISIAINVFYASMGSNDYYRFCLRYKDNIRGAKRARTIGKINFILLLPFTVMGVLVQMGVLFRSG
ncbi:MAG: zinc ribbon domain-containing protein [bacterium]|nr:MAG: zinc ribbon domain-containing protein [bacterium]